MKSLYLLRHAKSSWAEPGLSDRQRPLNKRGLRDAPVMGGRFRERGESVQRIVSSPAVRAHSTAELFAEACGFPAGEIAREEDLYFLGDRSIEHCIRGQDDRMETLMLVFHNPDITHFAKVRLNCEIAHWSDWSRDSTSFEYFDYPKNDSGEVLRK
jgi:phosphohistidine phosphatase